MRKKWIKLFPLLIGAVIAYCLLWYVIPQNKGGEVAAIKGDKTKCDKLSYSA